MDACTATERELQEEMLSSELSDNSRTAYQKGWGRFLDYCLAVRIDNSLPVDPDRIAIFLVQPVTRPSPRSGRMFSIEAMLQATPDTLIGKRGAAIIAVRFAGALRRSETSSLNVEDVKFLESRDTSEERMILTIRRSKTDQLGREERILVLDGEEIRPIDRLRIWLQSSGITTGPLLHTMKRRGCLQGRPMNPGDIARIVKNYSGLVRLDQQDIAGNSLRAGHVTSAKIHHAQLDKIMCPASSIIADSHCFIINATQRKWLLHLECYRKR